MIERPCRMTVDVSVIKEVENRSTIVTDTTERCEGLGGGGGNSDYSRALQ